MRVYHGSQTIIPKPVYGLGNPQNDYGLGFYCTPDLDLAKEWACTEDGNGYANEYRLDMDGLSVLKLTDGNYTILSWLAILLQNRTFKLSSAIAREGRDYLLQTFLPEYTSFDVIIGYRANDSYFSFASAFLNNTISLSQLETAMYLGQLGDQVVLKTQRAFAQISFITTHLAEKETYYPLKEARDTGAREAFRSTKGAIRALDAIYLVDILRERWNTHDPRLRRDLSK